MLSSLIISLRCILPIMVLILLGYCLRHIGFLTENGTAQMDKLCFRLLMPAMLFRSVVNADFSRGLDVPLILIALGISAYSFVAAMILSRLKCGNNGASRASMAQAILRNNSVVFGTSLIISLYGEASTGIFSMLLAFIIPVNNILTVILMSVLTAKQVDPLKILKDIVTNPFVIAVVAGILVNLSGWKLFPSAVTIMNNLAGAATAVSLMGLGAGIRFERVSRGAWGNVAFGTFARLVLLPLVCVPFLILLGVRGIRLVALYVLVATPTAGSSYVMAKEMGADAELAGHLVVTQSAFSPLTLLIGFTLLSSSGMI